MYLTRMQLNVNRHNTIKALSEPGVIHGTVESSFSGDRRRRLWRIDCLDGSWYLLIVSEDKPDMTEAVKQFGFMDRTPSWETRDYSLLLDRICTQDRWHFRLKANPTRSCTQGMTTGTRGKVYAHVTVEQQKRWLIDRAERHGFSVRPEEFEVTRREWNVFHKRGKGGTKVSILSVTYEGILTVENRELFQETLVRGIGRGKAYGMGLLTVASLREGKNHE